MTLFSFIKSKISIVDVISEYVHLKQLGSYCKGMCPFHSESDASFTVSPDKGIFHCFGCSAGGDAISFVAKMENISQIAAARILIERYKLQIPKELDSGILKSDASNLDDKNRYSFICDAISGWLLNQLELNKIAMKYLEGRGFDSSNINRFKIGYMPSGPKKIESFIKDMQKNNILLKEILDTGFLVQALHNIYSPFEERIIFPIHDSVGKCIGFGGRVFKKEDERAKYYNSKDLDFFKKGSLLYGFNLAKSEIRKKEYAFLVEGYVDCITMVKYGYDNTVATLGTACTEEHLKILSRFIKVLYVLYDGDLAGQKAILRLVELCWEVNLDLKIVVLPPEDDPDSFLRKGGNLNLLIDKSRDIWDFFVDSLGDSFSTKPLAEKLESGRKIIEVIVRLDDPFKKDLLLQRASIVMQLPLDTLKEFMKKEKSRLINKNNLEALAEKSNKTDKNEENPAKDIFLDEAMPQLEKKILFAIINNMDKNPSIYLINQDDLPYFSEQTRLFFDKIKAVSDLGAEKRFSAFFDSLEVGQQGWVSRCALEYEQDISLELFNQLVVQFHRQKWKSLVKVTRLEILKAKKERDSVKMLELSQRFLKLKQEMKGQGII